MRYYKVYLNSFRGLSPESWMLAAVMLINRSGSMVLPFLGVYMVDKLHFTIQQSGIVLSFYGIGSVLGSWLGGMITDRIGEYRVQSMSLFLSVPLFCLLPFFTSVTGLAIIILCQSTISETFRPANSVAITRYAAPENITRAFSLNRMAINLGFSIGPALGGILSSISYSFLFYCNALGAFIAAMVYVLFFHKRHAQSVRAVKKEADAQAKPAGAGRSPYTDKAFIIFCILCVIYSVCFFQFFNTLPIFYKDVAGLDRKSIGYLLGYSGFIIVLMEMVLVRIAEKKMSLHATLLAGTILCGLSYIMLAFNHHIATLVISMSLLCVGEIWTLPFMSTVTAIRSGEHNKGAYMGMNGMSYSISFIITPFLGTSVAAAYGFDFLWIATCVVMILTAIGFYYNVKKMLKDE